MFVCMNICVPHAWMVPKEVRRRCQSPWDQSYKWLWATLWVLEAERGFSARTTNALTAAPSLLPWTWHFRWVRCWDHQEKRIYTVTSHVWHEVSELDTAAPGRLKGSLQPSLGAPEAADSNSMFPEPTNHNGKITWPLVTKAPSGCGDFYCICCLPHAGIFNIMI